MTEESVHSIDEPFTYRVFQVLRFFVNFIPLEMERAGQE